MAVAAPPSLEVHYVNMLTNATADQGSSRTQSTPMQLALELLFMLTSREITIRYKQSVMGLFWALLMPTLVVLGGLMVRAAFSRISGSTLEMQAIAAIVLKASPWAFFVTGLRLATNSLTSNSNLVSRARCPRIVFPLSAVLSALFDFGVALVPIVLVLALVGVPLTPQALWALPLLMVLVLLVAGAGVLLATANLFFRDVKYLVEVFLMFAIFFTPVLYEAELLGAWKTWALLNPVAPLLEGLYTAVVRGHAPDPGWTLYSLCVSIVLAAAAAAVFRAAEPAFADNI